MVLCHNVSIKQPQNHDIYVALQSKLLTYLIFALMNMINVIIGPITWKRWYGLTIQAFKAQLV